MDFSNYLSVQRKKHRYRHRQTFNSGQDLYLKQGKQKLLNFSSNDYLGLANDPRIIEYHKRALDDYGVGSGASQLICGYKDCHQELELSLAKFLGQQRALILNSGYVANLVLQQSLLNRKSTVFLDRLCHASMIDAARLSGAKIKRYQHADMDSLRSMLEKDENKDNLIGTDSVFSMDGDIAPLSSLQDLAREFNTPWLLDDAHGFCVLGKEGKGSLNHESITIKPDIYLATFGKALGSFGAFIAGDEDLIETVIQKGRGLIYSTALPPALIKATIKSFEIAKEEIWRRKHLETLISYFRLKAEEKNLPLMSSLTPIQPMLIGNERAALSLSEYLRQKDTLVTAIRPPTVPENSSRLRITLTAKHKEEHIDLLLGAIKDYLEKYGNE